MAKFLQWIFSWFNRAGQPAVTNPSVPPTPATPAIPIQSVIIPPAKIIARPGDLPPGGHYASTKLQTLTKEYLYYALTGQIEAWAIVGATEAAKFNYANKALYDGFAPPWWVLGILDRMEGNADPANQIANGERWDTKSKNVPAGLGPYTSKRASIQPILDNYAQPSSWNVDLAAKDWTDLGWCFWFMNSWNGFGAQELPNALGQNTSPSNASPDIYSGSEDANGMPLFICGKDTSDNNFDPLAKSDQVGVLAQYLALKQLGFI